MNERDTLENGTLVSFSFYILRRICLVDITTPVELRASGQTLASAFYIGVSLLVTPTLSGVLANAFGVDITLLLMGMFSVLALLLYKVYKKI